MAAIQGNAPVGYRAAFALAGEISGQGAEAPAAVNGVDCVAVARAGLGPPAKTVGAEVYFPCNQHSDQHPSMKVNTARDCWMCGPCGASGNAWQLAAFISGHSADDKRSITSWLRENNILPPANTNGHVGKREPVAVYDYKDEAGELLYQTCRFDPKDFRQRRPDGKGGWVWSLEGCRLVPYRLPDFKDAPVVWICEGEKDCDNLHGIGIPATTSPMGANKWRESFNTYFVGKRVVVVPDNDAPGEQHALTIARNLLPVAAGVKILRIPKLAPKGDVSDFLAAGGTRDELAALAKAAPLVTAEMLVEPEVAVGTLLSEVQPERVQWLWRYRVPLGKVTLLDGDPGLGKSLLTAEIAARVTRGEPLPGDDVGVSGGVVIMTAEDGLGDTVRPRCEAAGADLSRIVALKHSPDKEGEACVSVLPAHLATVEAAIRRVKAKLVVVDVLFAYLGSSTNTYRDQDVRLALAPVSAMAQRTGAAVVCLRHLNKAGGGTPITRGGGSIGIVGAARAGLLVAVDPEDPERRVLAQTKCNLGPMQASLAYRIVGESDECAPRIQWEGESPHSAAALLAQTQAGDNGTRVEQAKEFLATELADGPRGSKDIIAAGERVGLPRRTLFRAKSEMGIKASKLGMGRGWEWRLPGGTLPKSAKNIEECQLKGWHPSGTLGTLRESDGNLEIEEL